MNIKIGSRKGAYAEAVALLSKSGYFIRGATIIGGMLIPSASLKYPLSAKLIEAATPYLLDSLATTAGKNRAFKNFLKKRRYVVIGCGGQITGVGRKPKIECGKIALATPKILGRKL